MDKLRVGHPGFRLRLLRWSAMLAIGLWATAAHASAPVRIDLTRTPWYAIQGFTGAYTGGFSEQQGAVKVAGFPIWPLRIFHVPTGSGQHHFGLETTFSLASGELAGIRSLALFLPSAGQSWALYLNGHPLRGEVRMGPDGNLLARRTVRNEIVHLPHEWLLAGPNRLVMHVAGDASAASWAQNDSFGFYLSEGYVVGEFEDLLRLYNAAADVSAIAMYLILGLLSLLLFSYRRREKPFLYFALFTMMIFVYFSVLSPFVFLWFGDTTWLTRLEYAALAAAAPFALLFIHSFLRPGIRATLPIRFYALFCAALTVANLALPFQYNVIALRLWQWTVFPALAYSGYQMFVAIRERRPDALKLAPGMLVFFITVAWDVFNSIYTLYSIRLAQFGFLFFVFSIAVILANRFLQMHQDAERLNGALVDSEARLQSLFEATVEAICIHESNLIVDANPSFATLFGISVDDAKGKRVTDFFTPESEAVLLREFAIAKRPYEATALAANNVRFTAELINKSIPYAGRPLTATSIRDVTDLKNSEKKLLLRNDELEKLSRIMVDRELRMITLKKELEVLRKKPVTDGR